MLTDKDHEIICEHFTIPDHIKACASAIRYDLYHGPCWSRIPQGDVTKFTIDCYATLYEDVEQDKQEGDIIEETYVGKVAQTLRDYLSELPSESWYNQNFGDISRHEPEGWTDEDGEWCEPFWEDYYKLDHRDLVEILFGETIAREFN